MNRSKKFTAWKKNRKFGDIHGGRNKMKCTDGIFKRYHDLLPISNEEKPIFIKKNTSKDFYFPITIEEIKEVLSKLPKEHSNIITHIWLDKVNKKDYLSGKEFQAEFICGSGVYLIKLNAFPKNLKMFLGEKKPTKKDLNFYNGYSNELLCENNTWFLQWTEESIKKYYLDKLLVYEIGQAVDYVYNREWSKANKKKSNDFANNYAIFWTNQNIIEINE